MTVIGDDGAPRAERTVVLWNPPLLDAELGLRGSALAEAAKLQAGFVERGLRTLTFAKSRKAAELDPPLHGRAARRTTRGSRPTAPATPPQQRREIERRLAEGDLLGVSSTDALELGIDIGLLDAVISVGFPGTVASLRQQWGRAGRRGHGLAVLVATEDALDQYFMREPDKLLGRRVEAAILDHANPRVLAGHVRAAAYEAPIDEGDARAPRRGGARGGGGRSGAAPDPARDRLGGDDDSGGAAPAALGRSPTPSPSSTPRPAPSSASSSAHARTRPCIAAPSTFTAASRSSSRELDERSAARGRRAVPRRLVHPAEARRPRPTILGRARGASAGSGSSSSSARSR